MSSGSREGLLNLAIRETIRSILTCSVDELRQHLNLKPEPVPERLQLNTSADGKQKPWPNARERKQLIAKCKELREKLTRQQRGLEVATQPEVEATLAEYKAAKDACRQSAAVHIQARWRGYLARRPVASRNDANPLDRLQRQIGAKRQAANRTGPPEKWSLADLQADKKMLKHLLASVENKLKRKTGKLQKADKEPYRPIYQMYKQMKALIAGRAEGSSNSKSGGSNSGSDSSEGKVLAHMAAAMKDEKTSSTGATAASNNALLQSGTPNKANATPATAGVQVQGQVRQEMIERLKTEKRQLQLKLTKYEKEFESLKGRSIKFAKDIAPVRAEWLRYKDLKSQLAELDPASAASN